MQHNKVSMTDRSYDGGIPYSQVCSRFVSVPCEVCPMKLPNNTVLRMYLHSPLLTGANWVCHLWLWLLRFAKFMVTKIYVDIGGKKINSYRERKGVLDWQWRPRTVLSWEASQREHASSGVWPLAPASKNWMPPRMGPYGGEEGAHTAQSLRLKNKARMSKTRAGGSPSGEGTGGDGGGGAPQAWGKNHIRRQRQLFFCCSVPFS